MILLRRATSVVCWLTLVGPVFAQGSNFADRYIAAHGACTQLPQILSTAPFGKPLNEWDDGDLSSMNDALRRCQLKNPYGEWTKLSESVSQSYLEEKNYQARAQARLDYEKEEAAQRENTQRRKAAVERADAERKLSALATSRASETAERQAAEANAKATLAQQEATQQHAKDVEARAALAQVQARAKLGVEDAERRIREAEERLQNADRLAKSALEDAHRREAIAKRDDSQRFVGSPSSTRAAMTENFIGCITLSDLVSSVRAIQRGDGDIGAALVNSNQCFKLSTGTKVRVKASDAKAAEDPKVVCVEVSGHDECLWVPTASIEAD